MADDYGLFKLSWEAKWGIPAALRTENGIAKMFASAYIVNSAIS